MYNITPILIEMNTSLSWVEIKFSWDDLVLKLGQTDLILSLHDDLNMILAFMYKIIFNNNLKETLTRLFNSNFYCGLGC